MKLRNLLLLATLCAAAFSAQAQTTVTEKTYALPHCAKPFASILVGKMTCKAASCQAAQRLRLPAF